MLMHLFDPHSDPRQLTPDEEALMARIWQRRAALLAQTPPAEIPGDRLSLVVVRLGREFYGLPAQYVYDIRPLESLTPVPRTPDWLAGVVNLRGRVLSVFDLTIFYNLPAAEPEPATAGGDLFDLYASSLAAQAGPFLVVLETAAMELALRCDDVLTVRNVPVSQIVTDDSLALFSPGPANLRGVYHDGDTAILILDLPALLADKRLIIAEELL